MGGVSSDGTSLSGASPSRTGPAGCTPGAGPSPGWAYEAAGRSARTPTAAVRANAPSFR